MNRLNVKTGRYGEKVVKSKRVLLRGVLTQFGASENAQALLHQKDVMNLLNYFSTRLEGVRPDVIPLPIKMAKSVRQAKNS